MKSNLLNNGQMVVFLYLEITKYLKLNRYDIFLYSLTSVEYRNIINRVAKESVKLFSSCIKDGLEV